MKLTCVKVEVTEIGNDRIFTFNFKGKSDTLYDNYVVFYRKDRDFTIGDEIELEIVQKNEVQGNF